MGYNTPTQQRARVDSKTNKNYLLPLILVTSLFFLWGLAYGLLDVLNKHFQEALEISKQRSTLLQASYFGAYFCMALPAGAFMKKVRLPKRHHPRTVPLCRWRLSILSIRFHRKFHFLSHRSLHTRKRFDFSGNSGESICYRSW
jgi:hypothetical protein